jgi:hypothetical protein
MPASNGADNGITISDKVRFSWAVVLIIIGVVLAVAGFAYTLQGGVVAHCGNVDIHHSSAALDANYVQKGVSDQRYIEIIRRLDRIDNKLDSLK